MKKLSLAVGLAVSCCAGGGLLEAQAPFTPEAEKLAAAMLDGKVAGDKLDCQATTEKPFFDFSFRFEMRYVVRCPYRQFDGEPDHLAAARVRPVGGAPVILGDVYSVPALPENMRGKVNIGKFKGELEFSGAIGVGEGEYEVELLVADEHHRFYRKRWKTRAERQGADRKAQVSLQPNQVAPLVIANVDERPANQSVPLRLTVLLNAAPIYPFSRRLRAWDRAFLLGSVTSLMRQVPSASVRLVAFNADQQKEVFRADSLDRTALSKLGGALRQLELGTVSYRTLEQRDGWAELLNQMVGEESASEKRADAVVFLGPRMRQDARIRRENLTCRPDQRPQLFYLEYFAFVGGQYPDSIDHLTKDCKGRVLGFHSPGELGAAIEKMRVSLISQRK